MLNYALFRASFGVILQCFASKISTNIEKSVHLEALLDILANMAGTVLKSSKASGFCTGM